MLSPRGAGGGRTSTASWRLWSKRSERNNRLLAVTAFPLKCVSLVRRPMERWGVRKSVAGLPGHSLAAKGGNEGCLSGRLVRPRRASTAFLIDLGISTAGGTGHHRHRPRQHRPGITSPSACIPSFPSIPSLPSLDLFDRACLFRSTPCAEQAEQVEQKYRPESPPCSVPFRGMRGTSGTDGTKTSALSGYLVPGVPPVPFPLWNGTRIASMT